MWEQADVSTHSAKLPRYLFGFALLAALLALAAVGLRHAVEPTRRS